MQLKLLRSLKRKVSEAEIFATSSLVCPSFPGTHLLSKHRRAPCRDRDIGWYTSSLLNTEPQLLQANSSPAAELTAKRLLCRVYSGTSGVCYSLMNVPRKNKHTNALAAQSSPWTAKPGLQGTWLPPKRSHTRSTTYQQVDTESEPLQNRVMLPLFWTKDCSQSCGGTPKTTWHPGQE